MTRQLEDLIEQNGVACPMQLPNDRQSNNNIIRQLGLIYGNNPTGALKEYITNAKDAGATEVTITLGKGTGGGIVITDNGHGMCVPKSETHLVNVPGFEFPDELAPYSILRLPKSIGNSAKRYVNSPDITGNKAIGALAWQSLGNKVIYTSRKQGEKAASWYCAYIGDGHCQHDYKTFVATEHDCAAIAYNMPAHGTRVEIKDVLAKLSPALLAKEIGSMYRDWILEKSVLVTIREGRNELVVRPEEYQGLKLVSEEVQTKKGPLQVELRINPAHKNEIRLKHKDVTLVDDFGKNYRTELGSDAWASGMITGQIKADWLEAGAGRTDLAPTADSTRLLFEHLSAYNPLLEEAVEKHKSGNDRLAQRRFYHKLAAAVSHVIRTNPEYERLISGFRYAKQGKVMNGQPGEGIAPPTPDVDADGTDRGRGRDPKKHYDPREPDAGKPIDTSKDGTTTGKKCLALGFDYQDDFGNNQVLSRLEVEHSLIVFNSEAPPYIAAMADPEKKAIYHAAVVAKELMSLVYKEPRELADRMIEFQQKTLDTLMQTLK
jgi:hypothetical protein